MSDELKVKVMDGSNLEKTEMMPIHFDNEEKRHAYIMNFLNVKGE